MKTKTFLPLLFFFLVFCSPKERLEKALHECYAQSLTLDQVDSLVDGFGDYLLAQKVLKSKSSKGYEDLLKRIAKGENIPIVDEDSTHSYLIRPYIKDFREIAECLNLVMESPEWDNSVPGKFENEAIIRKKTLDMSGHAQLFLDMTQREDYEMSYYKFQIQKFYDFYNSLRIHRNDSL